MPPPPAAPSDLPVPSEIFRDACGIPHLRAGSPDDLSFLQGYNAAADRSWQIEMERWRSEGRTSEHLGADGLDWDRFARRVRLDDTARRCFENLDADTKRWCTAYVDGVNYAREAGRRDAAEFRSTGYAEAFYESTVKRIGASRHTIEWRSSQLGTVRGGLQEVLILHSNEVLIRKLFDLYMADDRASAVSLFAEDAAFRYPGQGPLHGVYQGHNGILSLWSLQDRCAGGQFRPAQLLDLVAGDRNVFLFVRLGPPEGPPSWTRVVVYTVGDGRIEEARVFEDDPVAAAEYFSQGQPG